MTDRVIYLDRGVGETRGVLALDGRPERLLIHRDDDDPRLGLGARLIARVANLEPALATAFLDLGGGLEAIMPFKPEARPVRGAAIEVEIRSEPRDGKLATTRYLGAGEGAPRLLARPDGVAEALQRIARDAPIREDAQARVIADEAEAEALETLHPLPGGGTLAIEPTRALTAIDIDLGERKGGDAKRATRQANLAGLTEAARLLRLKGLGGIVVIDLAGRGHDGAALLAAARLAFAADNPGVAFGPISRFGTLELLIPRRTRPLLDRLRQPGGALSDRTLAQRLIRRLETEALAQPAARLTARCAPVVARETGPWMAALAARFGARLTLSEVADYPEDRIDVSAT
ncbi:ribonuclease E/G [Phenylobacterium sp.]|jgi:Ribonuclease G/E|uniref:ribonuclease E/G n=1 Tax=Phenylobacterium sp. TaxID=1871053 RepID=UPI0037CB0A2A